MVSRPAASPDDRVGVLGEQHVGRPAARVPRRDEARGPG